MHVFSKTHHKRIPKNQSVINVNWISRRNKILLIRLNVKKLLVSSTYPKRNKLLTVLTISTLKNNSILVFLELIILRKRMIVI